MPDPANRERAIFEAALELTSAGERRAYVSGACGDDAELRERVETLVRAHEEAAGFLPQDHPHLAVLDRAGVPILDFTYADSFPWPPDADGNGRSLTLIAPQANPAPGSAGNWRVSVGSGGSAGTGDALSLASYPALLDYAITQFPTAAIEAGYATFEWRERLGADEATITPQFSTDLASPWQSDAGDGSVLVLLSNVANPDGTRTLRMRAATPASERQFFRLRVTGL